jgi:F-type H+-transporting ATPase subunit epsilon
MADPMSVELVAADRTVWTGEADMVIARTADGEIGVLPNHSPVLGVLVEGAVQVRQADGQVLAAAVHGGFLSIADNTVAILAEQVELAEDIDVSRAQQARDRATGGGGDDEDEDRRAARARAEARLRAAELAS